MKHAHGQRRRWWLASLVVVVVMLGWVVPAGATTTNPYLKGAKGYDVAQPNCSETPPGGFAIVGLGGGRPFSTNSCLKTEWKTALHGGGTPLPALYFNTGYSGAYGHDVTATCNSYAGPSVSTSPKHDQSTYMSAWEIGCSEAAYARKTADTALGIGPSVWWADIETGNSWSTNKTVNGYAVDGISYEMQQLAHAAHKTTAFGVYSYPAAWTQIVGTGFTATPPFPGDWGPGLSCTQSGFSGAPVWLVQGATAQGVDTDTGCG